MSEEPGIGCKICFNADGREVQGKIIAINSPDGKNGFYTLRFEAGGTSSFSKREITNLRILEGNHVGSQHMISQIGSSYSRRDFVPDHIGIGGID